MADRNIQVSSELVFLYKFQVYKKLYVKNTDFILIVKKQRVQQVFELYISERLRTSEVFSSTNYVLMKPYLQYWRNKTHLGKVFKVPESATSC